MKFNRAKKAIIGLLGLVIIFLSNCTYDNELDLRTCPENITFNILSLNNAQCGAAIGMFEVDVIIDNAIGIDPAQIEYSINNQAFTKSTIFENLVAGTYIVTVRLQEGCSFSELVEIENEAGLQIETEVEADDCSNQGSGSLSVNVTDASGVVTYSLEGETNTSGVFPNLKQGIYQLLVQDQAGCEVAEQVEIVATVAPETVYEIVRKSCALSSCHGGSRSPDLATNQNIEDAKARIVARTSNKTMPPASSNITLTDQEIELIKCWSEQ